MSNAPSPTAPAPDAEPSDPVLSGTIFAFTPVPMDRVRAGGWSPLAQRRFIHALSAMGPVGAAVR